MNQKSQLLLSKDAYLQVDFAFAALGFFVLFFISYSFYDSYNENNYEWTKNKLYLSDSKDICNLLVSTDGYPQTWESNISSAITIGLKNSSGNILNSSKIDVFSNSNYLNITDKFYLDQSYVNIKIIGLRTNTSYVDFGYELTPIEDFSSYTCYSYYNNEIVEVKVEVWK